jgi:peptidyl-prolyl cis-trans isomerase SurA
MARAMCGVFPSSVTHGVRLSLLVAAALSLACVGRTHAANAPQGTVGIDSAETIDGIAAIVGGDIVLLSELEQQSFLAATQAEIDPSDTVKVHQLRQDVLDRLIDEKVVLQEAARQAITIPDSEVTRNAQQALENVRRRFPSDDAYRKELAAEGITESDLLDRYKKDVNRQLLAQRLILREIGNKVEVTDKDITDYYEKNKSQLPQRPATAHLAQLVVLPTASQEIEDAAREKALALLQRLQGGADFATFARQYSADSTTARNGGDLGWFGRGEMDRAFENVVFGIDAGKIGGPVRTRFGYHLVKVEEKNDDRVHARHILIRVVPGSADIARARRQAEQLRQRIVKGESFASLATAYSMDPATKDKGGDLGEVPLEQLTPQLRKVAETLPIGGVSNVLSDDNVFYLFSVIGRTPAKEYTFAEIKEDLRELVRQEKSQALYDKWVKDLRAKTFIEVKPRANG